MAVIRALHAAGADWKVSKSVFMSVLCHLSRLAQEGDVLSACGSLHYQMRQFQSAGAIAVRFRHSEAVDFCLGLVKGLSVSETWRFTASPAEAYVIRTSRQVSLRGDSMSLLSLAMSTLDIRTAESLLNHGARDDVVDPVGRGALAYALDATRLQTTNAANLDSAVKLLVRHGVDINGLRSPDRLQANAVEKLLDAWERDYTSGRLLDCQTVFLYDKPEGGTALTYTIFHGNNHRSLPHCIKVLCNNGAKVDIRDRSGKSALILAKDWLEGKDRSEVERILLLHSN